MTDICITEDPGMLKCDLRAMTPQLVIETI